MTVDVKPLWTIEDVSTYLGVPVKTLYGWRLKKVGPAAVCGSASICGTTRTRWSIG
ncbi:helix-turn-helix domain-containing protein [Kribbella sp. NBC_01484]|uniref:hypothetical protein n=1 Tax=Kribbella sp. NBC_01484 TaxID=2903579 RepID=UPI002E37A691|nr:hypothetical protein [Kribbella sp. NBC_01484]